MKRIHLFEFEDFNWFPNWLRNCMTNYIETFHRLLGTHEQIAELLNKCLKATKSNRIIDLCSGAGGPMIEVVDLLKKDYQYSDLSITFTDLYPNQQAVQRINKGNDHLKYHTTSVDAANVPEYLDGVRSMICSFHHMNEEVAADILKNAQETKRSICIYEISDNSFPKWIWWIAFPINILTVLFITPFVRPLTWQQLVFTYLIPILPVIIAWDGAVSNARTYTLSDLDILLSRIGSNDFYKWEKGTLKGKGGNKLYLLGYSVKE